MSIRESVCLAVCLSVWYSIYEFNKTSDTVGTYAASVLVQNFSTCGATLLGFHDIRTIYIPRTNVRNSIKLHNMLEVDID